MAFAPRTREQIIEDAWNAVIANSPLTDKIPGSVIDTIIGAFSDEDYEQYFQMRQLLNDFSLDTATGSDLDKKAVEYGESRRLATQSTGFVTISDANITMVQGDVAAGGIGSGSLYSGHGIESFAIVGTDVTITFDSLHANHQYIDEGDKIIVTGASNAGNNGTFDITSVTYGAPGTVVVTNASGVNEVASAAVGEILDYTIRLAPGDGAAFGTSGTALVDRDDVTDNETLIYVDRDIDILKTSTQILKDHGAGAPVIKATVGDRTFVAGEEVIVPAGLDTPEVSFETTDAFTILDGDNYTANIPVRCNDSGTIGNVIAGQISEFRTPPFASAVVTNPAGITNALDDETDQELRDRLKDKIQSLSTANEIAITTEVINLEYDVTGQRVRFAQYAEDANPCNPGILYIDDGSGFTPTTETETYEVIVSSATGGEKRLYLNPDQVPVISDSNLKLFKNGVLLTLNVDYVFNKHIGLIELNSALLAGESLTAGDNLGIDGYTYYTGLIQFVQWTIDGRRIDRENYPGIRAGGVQITVTTPVIQQITVSANITTTENVSEETVKPQITQNLINYVNNLGIGSTVIKSQLIEEIMKPEGMLDVDLSTPSANIPIADGVLPRLIESNIALS